MIDFSNGESTSYPYPIITVEECFDKVTLNKLIEEFPDVSSEGTVMGGRKEMNVKSPSFPLWIKTAPTWEKVYNWINSDSLFKTFLEYYGEQLQDWDSVIGEKSSLTTDCFTHIDWSSATDGYVREIHRDTNKRIWNFLIFFNDKDWEGGDFLIHSSDSLSELDRQIWDLNALPVHKTIEAKKNKGVFFLSTPDSYHSVSKQFNTNNPRKFIYGAYSYKNGDVFNKRTK
jgi:hypothetical protein